jgi:hypothetical protein
MTKKPYDDWLKLMAKQPERVTVADDNAEESDVVICRLVTTPLIMADNLVGHCSKCFKMIQFRPHVPKLPRKLCDGCAFKSIKGERDLKFYVTENTLNDLATVLLRKKAN